MLAHEKSLSWRNDAEEKQYQIPHVFLHGTKQSLGTIMISI